ncbi:MAG: MFS transporter, partial [Clostridia bacterium]|nr:MFS transporter [Clostridia bacterium]
MPLFLITALAGAVLSAISLAIFAPWVTLRKISYMGEALSHIAFAGIAIAIITGINLTLSATIFVCLVSLGISWLARRQQLQEANTITIFLSLSMALGIILISLSRTYSFDLASYLFGNVLLIQSSELLALGILTVMNIAFVLIFIKNEFQPNAVELSLVAAAVQGGALIGALIGGVVADRLGRKRVFILTMVLFIILAIAQGFSQNIIDLIIIRLLIGIPLGSDISNGYAYIMESMSKGTREQMGSRWQFMFGLGEVFSIIVITILFATNIFSDTILWRVALALGAVPALLLLLL